MEAYTDYPFTFLGDIPHNEAPIRKCIVITYDGNKYCDILVEGHRTNIKAGYIYTKPGRCGEVPILNHRDLSSIMV